MSLAEGMTDHSGTSTVPLPGGVLRDSIPEPVDLVDPFIGVLDPESNCVIGPQVPFGSINPSPQTPSGSHDGYSPSESIRGFGQLHVSGTGWGKYGQIFVSPQLGLAVGEGGHDSPKSDEVARAYEYSVVLARYNIGVRCAPSRHSAIYRFTYPKSDSANLLIDITHNIPMDIATEIGGRVSAGEIEIDTSHAWTVRGWGKYSGGFGEGEYDVFFCAKFDRRPHGCGTWCNGKVSPGSTSASLAQPNDRVGTYVTFSTQDSGQVLMKVAVSLKSVQQAEYWLDSEIPGWDYERVKSAAKVAWNRELGKVEIEGGVDSVRRMFYTALYHSMLMPRDRTGDMKGFPDSAAIWDDEYAVWDTWRTVFPLMALVEPATVAGNVNSFITRFKENGRVKDSFIAGKDMNEEQGGNNVDNIITDAFVKGISGVNWAEAWRIVKHDADEERKGWEGSGDTIATREMLSAYRRSGWIPAGVMSCSKTLEYAYNDYCTAVMAKRLGKPGDYPKYLKRSTQWRHLWNGDATSDGFKGFIVPRNPDGSWVDIDPKKNWGSWKEFFYEGNSWTYSYFVPHQFTSLVGLCGGKERYVTRLEHALENGLIDYSNEPAFLVIPSFHYAGRPDLTGLWVRKLMSSGYSLRGYPGNDDSGAMSSWFVFAAMGFFPNAGQDLYFLHGPSFSRIAVHLQNGKTIRIVGRNVSMKNLYVQSLKVNGKAWSRPFITHALLEEGALLDFVMGDHPSSWGK